MTTIVTRAGKGSPLSHAEMDANLNNLNNNKLEITTAASTYATQASIVNMLETTDIGVSVQGYSVNLTSYATTAPTAAGLALLDDANASAQRTTLGLGTAATANTGTSAGNVVILNGSSQLPAVDGSLLTNISAIPSGAVLAFAMNSAPTGWLSADGSAVSRTTYAALFAAVSTTYGVGDGSTTFNLPDLRGYFVRGTGTNSDGTAAGTFGTKQTDDFKSHTHGLGLRPNMSAGGGVSADGSSTYPQSGSTYATGGTETRPRNIAMLYCIKV